MTFMMWLFSQCRACHWVSINDRTLSMVARVHRDMQVRNRIHVRKVMS